MSTATVDVARYVFLVYQSPQQNVFHKKWKPFDGTVGRFSLAISIYRRGWPDQMYYFTKRLIRLAYFQALICKPDKITVREKYTKCRDDALDCQLEAVLEVLHDRPRQCFAACRQDRFGP